MDAVDKKVARLLFSPMDIADRPQETRAKIHIPESIQGISRESAEVLGAVDWILGPPHGSWSARSDLSEIRVYGDIWRIGAEIRETSVGAEEATFCRHIFDFSTFGRRLI